MSDRCGRQFWLKQLWRAAEDIAYFACGAHEAGTLPRVKLVGGRRKGRGDEGIRDVHNILEWLGL